MKQISLIMLLIAANIVLNANPGTDYKFIEKRGNIVLYERWVLHNKDKVRELKAVFTAQNTQPSAFISLLRNEQKAYQWNPNAKKFSIAFTNEANVWHTYIRYKIPWPMDDQDCCLKYFYDKSAMNKSSVSVYFESASYTTFPIQKNVTRITGTQGSWQLEQKGQNQLNITYNIVTDKSASIPRWISDPIVYDNLFNTLSALKNLLEKNKN